MPVEVRLDRHADAALDFMVAVNELARQLARQLFADSGLAAAGHAHQSDHCGQTLGRDPLLMVIVYSVATPLAGERKLSVNTPG